MYRPSVSLLSGTIRNRIFNSHARKTVFQQQYRSVWGTADRELTDPREITLKIQEKTEDLLANIVLPLNNNTLGPLEKGSDKRTPLPFVFLLGNHSSGKSTFVNHVLQRQVQEAGVAPTDDGFTVIAPGPRDLDQDGPSLIGDPDMGFSSLRSYGPSLVHHVKLKVRTDLELQDVMLVDSPGMIDSPTDSISYVGAGRGRSDRGYDFEGAARWFAERADVILLFFDPDKPGTTGETLSVLTNSLAGMDHKLHIILNKVDQFEKIHDFARAYGSLCWNLSKVIPRKDLPRIYTMCTPSQSNISEQSAIWATSLADLESTRGEVIEEVKRAPERRIDNMVTQLDDSVRLLTMHATIMENVRIGYQDLRWKMLSVTGGIGLFGNALAVGTLWAFPSMWGFSASVSLSCLTGAAGVYLYASKALENKSEEMKQDEYLDGLFHRQYVRELADNDEYMHAMWHRVKPHLKSALHTIGIANLKKTTTGDIRKLKNIIQDEVPALRRIAAPLHKRIDTYTLDPETSQVNETK